MTRAPGHCGKGLAWGQWGASCTPFVRTRAAPSPRKPQSLTGSSIASPLSLQLFLQVAEPSAPRPLNGGGECAARSAVAIGCGPVRQSGGSACMKRLGRALAWRRDFLLTSDAVIPPAKRGGSDGGTQRYALYAFPADTHAPEAKPRRPLLLLELWSCLM